MLKIDIIGDIHGCYKELLELTTLLGYQWKTGIPVHPEGRKLGFVGDLTDRGPQSIKVIEIIYELVQKDLAYYVPGNHCNKLYRFFLGNKVQISHGLETTVAEFEALSKKEQQRIKRSFVQLYENAPLYRILDHHKLIMAHAGISEELIGKQNSRVKTFVLYGDITGEKHPDGSPIRNDWALEYKGKPLIVYGHTPVKEVRKVGNTFNIDTGAVFGGKLSSLRYPECEVVSVPSSMPHVAEKFRDFS
jgi:protein phosphatase